MLTLNVNLHHLNLIEYFKLTLLLDLLEDMLHYDVVGDGFLI